MGAEKLEIIVVPVLSVLVVSAMLAGERRNGWTPTVCGTVSPVLLGGLAILSGI
ncbi:hypothetical protein [Mycobacterium lepromatosis]|uniref:hypothetical protein n=1 Tax=Mycobacterium lepromatosis TaxID=480418 RepID=UPI000AC69ABC|nr:hypothetical protein [Mycobacterium lepromatosis]